MKTTLLALATLLSALLPARAENLIVNGDFETGALAPWTGGTIAVDPSGGFFATTAGSLTQTVTTTPGTKYLVSGDILAGGIIGTSVSITATPAAGGAPDGTRAVPVGGVTQGFIHGSLLFTASSASTTISISFVPLPGFITSITVDDVSMFEATATGKLAGKYSGNNVTTLALTNPALTNKATRKVTAIINENNQIYVLDGVQTVFAGVILNEGPFDFSSLLNPQASGIAKIRGKRIELEFRSNSLPATDSTGTILPNTVTNKIVLTKK